MIQPVSDWDFEQRVERAATPVLVLFWQPGCGHCQALKGQLERLGQGIEAHLAIAALNVQESRQIAAELEIESLPALALYRDGAFVRFIGGIGTAEALRAQLADVLTE